MNKEFIANLLDTKIHTLIALVMCLLFCFLTIPAKAQEQDFQKPRTLGEYIEQEKTLFDVLKKKHPIFQYEKEGRLVGTVNLSDRLEEFSRINGGPAVAKRNNVEYTAVTYRLGYETTLDYPNKFVGPEKCAECHPAQYEQWKRSRHAKVVRFPEELDEVDGDPKRKMYGTESSILPMGIYPEDVLFVLGTPRTKYGFLDKWVVRGTYHVEGGRLGDNKSKIVAGGNQFSRLWSEHLTPEMAKKINAFIPEFPTEMKDFGDSGSDVWGTNSYSAKNKKLFNFQPGSAYCEVCHTYKFDFKSIDEFYNALGNREELRKHTISKGISCEECHGAGAHLYGARGAGMPSNCERCHQRFSYNEADAKANPTKVFNSYFKSSCPSCGTEGAQLYNSAHYDKGMRCNTCHDPHMVTKNDWKDEYTLTGLKKECADCHETQKEFFKPGGIHAEDRCTACHMPNMMSCENFGAVQFPDHALADNVRASHIWNIKVDKTAKTLNPPEGEPRKSNVKGWTIARDEKGHFFVDLMWACGRTSFSDVNLVGPGASGCHSPVQTTLPDKLKYYNQEQVYNDVMKWQQPVKDGYDKIKAGIKAIDRGLADNTLLPVEKKAEIILLTKQAQEIISKLEKDGSWGVHGPAYSNKIVSEALVYIQQAQNILKAN